VESLEVESHPAHRVASILRLALLLLVAAVAAVLVLGRDHAAGKPVTTKLGATTQGREFKLGLDKDGRPAAFDTELLALCPTGRTIGMPWNPSDGDPVRFAWNGDRVHVQESGDGWKLALDGRKTPGGGLRGDISLVVHVTPKTKPAYDCTSPHVKFFAGA
jgi:hypothetical protein